MGEGQLCLILEDQEATRNFLADLVGTALPQMQVIAVRTLTEAKNFVQSMPNENSLNFCIVDLGLPDGSGVDFISQLKMSHPEVRCIVATIYDSDSYLFGALAAGAFGYLLKSESKETLVDILRRMNANEPPLSPAIARRILDFFKSEPEVKKVPQVHLSPRENETLMLLSQGLTVPEAATKLGLSSQTVAGYVKVIYQKLHVGNRVELLHEATRRGLI